MTNRRRMLMYVIGSIIGAIGLIIAAYIGIIPYIRGSELVTVQGIVTDNDGNPVRGVVVEIDGLSVTTGTDGGYVIRDVPIDTKTVTVRTPGAKVVKRALRISKGAEKIMRYDIVLSLRDRQPSPSLEITYPLSGGRVEIEEIVRGTSQNIPKEQAIWIIIYPHEVRRYYPQDYSANVQANGDWSSSAFIGIEIDVGKKFDIIAVLADKKTQDAFNDYLGECKEEQSWPGLERLHEGAVIYGRITVTRAITPEEQSQPISENIPLTAGWKAQGPGAIEVGYKDGILELKVSLHGGDDYAELFLDLRGCIFIKSNEIQMVPII